MIFWSTVGRISKQTIIGVVVTHDDGLEVGKGSCRQVAIVRIQKRKNRKQPNAYVLLRFQYSCATRLPDEMVKGKQSWRFLVARDLNCDQKLEDLTYWLNWNEDGSVNRVPRLKRVLEAEAEKIPPGIKLPCYILLPGDFKILQQSDASNTMPTKRLERTRN
jgi:hypothetical protein